MAIELEKTRVSCSRTIRRTKNSPISREASGSVTVRSRSRDGMEKKA